MISVVFSVLLTLQTGAPGVVSGRLTVEGGAQAPSSFRLPLIAVSNGTIPLLPTGANPTMTIRPQIDGAFRVQVQAGEYRLGVPVGLPPGYAIQSIRYKGVDLLSSPMQIPSGNSSDLDIILALTGPSPAVSVSGRVTGIAPGQFQRIALRESAGGELPAALETSIGADGSFTFPSVLPGRYIVYFRLRAVTQVTVDNKDVKDLTIAYPQDILVAGHVIVEGAQIRLPGLVVEGNGKAATLQVGTNGTFVLSLQNGENTIAVRNIPEAYRLKSVTYGDADLQKGSLKLDGPAAWDIIVRLAPKD